MKKIIVYIKVPKIFMVLKSLNYIFTCSNLLHDFHKPHWIIGIDSFVTHIILLRSKLIVNWLILFIDLCL